MTLSSLIPPPKPLVGIQWGSHLFTQPRLFGFGLVLPVQGLYAIMASDAKWGPWQFRPLYFGETENLKDRLTVSHEKYLHWRQEAGTLTIYVAHRPTLTMSNIERKTAERALIEQYNPPCNVQLNRLAMLMSMVRPLGK